MTLRCGCLNEGDETVFGPIHGCEMPPRTAVPGEPLPEVPLCSYAPGAVALPAQYNGDPDDWTEIHPYERVLSDGDGDLG